MQSPLKYLLLLSVPVALAAGCGSSEGPDAISQHTAHHSSGDFPECVACHAAPTATRRPVLGASGDFGGNGNIMSHHVAGTSDPSGDQCLVCHDLSTHTQGTVRLRNADTGAAIAYTSSANVETFCLSCHDTEGATITYISGGTPTNPFNDGSTLGAYPYMAGVKIKESWEKQYGHRRKGITCLGTGQPGTGCHGNYDTISNIGSINAHGSGNGGLLTKKLTLPILSDAWDASRYQLCLDCHTSYPSLPTIAQLTGVADGGNYAQLRTNYEQWPYTVNFMVTGFHDYYSYNMDRQYNLHLYHLIEGMGQWYYRGITDSIPSCVACHNVHGVDGQYYYLWDEWGFSIQNVSGVEYGKVARGNFEDDSTGTWVGQQYPEFCYNTCHWDGNYRYPRSPFNEAKAVASDASGGGPGLQIGDTVTIYFSDSTNGPAINETNINTVLFLSGGHSWLDSDKGGNPGQLTAVWSSANGKTNNALTITIFIANPGFGDPTIAVGDSITFDLATITDTPGNPIRGRMTLKGNF